MIFNEACFNNYANLQSTIIKSSDQSFRDYYHVFVTPPITDFWIDSSVGCFFVTYLETVTNQCRTLKKIYTRKETHFALCLYSGLCMSLKVIKLQQTLA